MRGYPPSLFAIVVAVGAIAAALALTSQSDTVGANPDTTTGQTTTTTTSPTVTTTGTEVTTATTATTTTTTTTTVTSTGFGSRELCGDGCFPGTSLGVIEVWGLNTNMTVTPDAPAGVDPLLYGLVGEEVCGDSDALNNVDYNAFISDLTLTLGIVITSPEDFDTVLERNSSGAGCDWIVASYSGTNLILQANSPGNLFFELPVIGGGE